MISPSPISSSTSAAHYHLEKNGQQKAIDGRAEYYSADQVRSSWGGAASAYAGLPIGGEVTKQQLIDVLDGKVRDFAGDRAGQERMLGKVVIDKETGERRLAHRAGLDFTFGAPKSVSIESEVFGRDEVRAAHEAAVQAGMDFLEQHAAQARVNGMPVQTGNLIYAKFEHSISREVDPQTHTHVLIANATVVDGVWYSLGNEKLLDLRTTADQIYKNELANQLIQRGFGVQWDAKQNFEITGYSKANLEVFSKRSAQLDEYLRARGIDPTTASYEQRQLATLATRGGKNAPESAVAQRASWQEEAKACGIEPAFIGSGVRRDSEAGLKAFQRAVAHLTEREAAFSHKDLYKAVAGFSEGKATYGQIEAAIRDALKTGEMIARADGKFTTREMVDAEKKMVQSLEAGRGGHKAVMTDREFDLALQRFQEKKSGELDKPFRLKLEQVNAARLILTGADRFQGVQGLAGTGKTTMLEFVREAAETKGWKVEGFSTGAAQAQKMEQESGIRSTTTVRHLIDDGVRVRDANLAARALATHSTPGRGQPDFGKLEKLSQVGSVTKEYDSTGRSFYTDKSGRTWTAGLYRETNVTESRNLNHAGLTETKYALVRDKGLGGLLGFQTVIKSGGSLVSEASGAMRDRLHEATRGSLGKEILASPAQALLRNGEAWRQAGVLESMAVRGKLAIENFAAARKEMAELKEQAAQIRPNNGRVLRIMDEASQAGQKQFNEVIRTTQESGARAVFLGDTKQHQSVEAGRAFENAQKHMPMAEMKDITRQRTAHMKDAVRQIVDGKHAAAVKGLETIECKAARVAVEDKWADKIDSMNAKLAVGKELTQQEKGDQRLYRDELKSAMKVDNSVVIKELAKQYAALPAQDRAQTLVLTSTNVDRQLINEAIRNELRQVGAVANTGNTFSIYEKTDRTAEELNKASSYEKGDVVRFTSAYNRIGAEKGSEAVVEKTDSRLNTVTVRFDDGRQGTFQADKLQGREVFNCSQREFAEGDRVMFTKNDRDLGFNNGDKGAVQEIKGSQLSIRLDSGDLKQVDLSQYKNVDHAYASTSHAAQGQTVDRAFIHHNTEAGRHGDREAYVNVTRAREDVRVFTQNAEKASMQSGVEMNKESAREHVLERSMERSAGTDRNDGRQPVRDVEHSNVPQQTRNHDAIARDMIAQSWERNFQSQRQDQVVDDRSKLEKDLDARSSAAQTARGYERFREMLREALQEKAAAFTNERTSSAVQASDFVSSAKSSMVTKSEAAAEKTKERGNASNARLEKSEMQNRQRNAGMDR